MPSVLILWLENAGFRRSNEGENVLKVGVISEESKDQLKRMKHVLEEAMRQFV